MAQKDFHNEEKSREDAHEEKSSALRDALLNKVQGEKTRSETHHVTPHEIGAGAAEEGAPLSRPMTFGGPSNLDLAVFCRQFATLIEVGIPVLRAMQMLSKRTSNGKLRAAVVNAAKGVEEGQMIHQAMARHTRVFSPLVVNIVRIGEVGGLIEDSLVRLAEIMESKARIKRKVIAAAMYPIVALCVAVMVITVIMVKAIPTFAEVYKGANVPLPPLTNLVIDLSKFFTGAWPILFILLGLGIFGIKMWIQRPGGARTFAWLGLHMPILKGITQKIAVARSTRTLGGLVAAGIPLVEALGITADTNENVLVADALQEVHDHVEKGERMADPLARAGVFPSMVVDMIAIGEETGTLDTMLLKVADIYDVEVDTTLSGLSSIIEPLLIIMLGGVVMFIALAVLLPYFKMASVIQ